MRARPIDSYVGGGGKAFGNRFALVFKQAKVTVKINR